MPNIPHAIPWDVWTEMALEMLDPRDLMALVLVVAPIVWPIGAVFSAKRVLTQSELDWFAAAQLSVVERFVFALMIDMENASSAITEATHGYLYQIDFPAVIWTRNGKVDSFNDLPAVESRRGDRMWYVQGKLHRDDDRPAYITHNVGSWWYRNGLCHRDGDRPAVERTDGLRFWYRDGVEYSHLT